MFTVEELVEVVESVEFRADYQFVTEALALLRLRRHATHDSTVCARVDHFAEAVLASSASWVLEGEAAELCRRAAEFSEYLWLVERDKPRRPHSLRAALLYEMAGLPAISGAIALSDGLDVRLKRFLGREGAFGRLVADSSEDAFTIVDVPTPSIDVAAFYADAVGLARYEQGDESARRVLAAEFLGRVAADLDLESNASEIRAFASVVRLRANRATVGAVSPSLFGSLKAMQGPSELFSAQLQALNSGLLDRSFEAWGLAAPTGSGKTFLTRLLISDLLREVVDAKVLYVVPSKALVSEVAHDLSSSLRPLGMSALALSAQIVELDAGERASLDNANVIVLTPEKADLLLRLGSDVIDRVRLAIVDEAHHIEAETRGVLLELYLWRMKRMLPKTRFVVLSAVAPNIGQLASWLGSKSSSLTVERRPTRMRAGVYRVKLAGRRSQGVIEYADGTHITVVPNGVPEGQRLALVQLVQELAAAGPVLTVAKGKRESENLAEELLQYQRGSFLAVKAPDDVMQSDLYRRLDSRLEREMYPDVPMRKLLPFGIAYHHAGLPPRVRHAVEDAIRARMVQYVFATTTLAEGVNFPFSSVVVQSIAIQEIGEKGRPARYTPVTPRTFWNIAGRAGRPGQDREGQAILFEPSLGAEKVGAVLDHYLSPSLKQIAPVRSALATSFGEIRDAIASGEFGIDSLGHAVLPPELPKRVRGAINLLRVGLVHARAAGLASSPEEIVESSFAASFLDSEAVRLARDVMALQDVVIDNYLSQPDAPSLEMIARLGLSIETLAELREYVASLGDWAIEKFGKLFFGGTLNPEQAKYVVSPVAKRMTELEGTPLGGFLADIILQWLQGVPFSRVALGGSGVDSVEELISVIHSRVQFLLPWGLYATNAIVEVEAKRRGIPYADDIQKLAYLADAGVPSFDALRLTHSGFERVDATRLAAAYGRSGGLATGVDVVGWLRTQKPADLLRIVAGIDSRRVDHDFERTLVSLGVR